MSHRAIICAVFGHLPSDLGGYSPGRRCTRCGVGLGLGLPVTPQTATMPPVLPPRPRAKRLAKAIAATVADVESRK
jgi:hypothetical protein